MLRIPVFIPVWYEKWYEKGQSLFVPNDGGGLETQRKGGRIGDWIK